MQVLITSLPPTHMTMPHTLNSDNPVLFIQEQLNGIRIPPCAIGAITLKIPKKNLGHSQLTVEITGSIDIRFIGRQLITIDCFTYE